jgi:hypothetical protein
MNEAPKQAPWVCPWRICDHEQAQKCRRLVKTGCGGRFPSDMTPEEAARQINFSAKEQQK